jgi:hypothetical protein
MDTLDGVTVSVAGDEDDRHVAYLAQPPSNLDPFVTAFASIRTISGMFSIARKKAC